MPVQTTAGRLALEDAVPPAARASLGELNKKGLEILFASLAELGPDEYRAAAKRLMDLGARATTASGGYSFGPEHMRPGPELAAVREKLNARVKAILSAPDLKPAQRDAELVRAALEHMTPIQDVGYREALTAGNPLALQVHSGAKGKPDNLRSLLAGDGLYTDQNFQAIPFPVTHSFAEGLRPHEYFAGTFGARLGLSQLKLGTAAAGYACLAGDTEVRMADGSARCIVDVKVGDWVLGADVTAHTFPVRVTGWFANGPRPCLRYTFTAGKQRKEKLELVCTPCHKILGKVKGPAPGTRPVNRRTGKPYGLASSIGPEVFPIGRPPLNRLRAVPAGPSRWEGRPEPWALLFGLLTGDGHTGRNITLSCSDPSLLTDITSYLDGLGVTVKPIKGRDYEYYLSSAPITGMAPLRPDGAIQCGAATILTARVAACGLRGKRSYEKQLPSDILDWDRKSVCDYLAGLFATDGTVSSTPSQAGVPMIGLGSTSRELVEGVRRLLAFRLGIHAAPVGSQKREVTVARANPNPKCPGSPLTGTYRTLHSIVIASREMVLRFADAVEMPGAKGRKLKSAIATMGPAPLGGDFVLTPDKPVAVGEVETYDLEVDHPDHLFVLANSLIVSNSKRLLHAAHRLVVTDREAPEPYDPKNPRGLPVDTTDPDNEGALLAHPMAGYPRNTVLTKEVMQDIQRQGHPRILVRSPLVGGPADGGVYGNDVGVRERGVVAPRGDFVGIAASQAMSEPMTQVIISSKHGGGVAGTSKGQQGFPVLDRMISVPEVFPGGAVHAQVDGQIGDISPAPQGGHYVMVGNQQHYMRPDLELRVKRGDEVEAGDAITDGTPNPAEFVRHKGVGAGSKMFVDAFARASNDAGFRPNRRNLELVARGLINHVRLDEPTDRYSAGEILPYAALEADYRPRDGHRELEPKKALGQYLERPVLHYSVGTRITPSVARTMGEFGVGSVLAHEEKPPFSPVMVRSQETSNVDPDWMTRGLGTGVQKTLTQGVHRGDSADLGGTSYVPALAAGVGFGDRGKTVGWSVDDLKKMTPPKPPG